MRILWLSHLVPYPPKGGVLQRSYHLLHELSKYHEVDLLAFNQPNLLKPIYDDIDSGLELAKTELGKFCNNVEVFDIETTKFRYGNIWLALKSLLTSDPYNISWLKSKKFSSALDQYLNENQYDLVHFDTISLVPYYRQIKNIPCVLDHHNIESHMLLHRATMEANLLKKWYFYQEGVRLEKYEKEFCPKFSLNITCSDPDTQRLIDITGSNNTITIPNGVDIEDFNPKHSTEQNDGRKRIVFIGRLNWYPNAEAVTFIADKIWPILKQLEPGVECDIIGANPPQSVVSLAAKDTDFRAHGFVDDIYPFMSSSTIYVCPITNGGGTKLKVLDALAMAMPLVANPFACDGIAVEDGKNVIFAETAQQFADAISQLLNDRVTLHRLSVNARSLIEDYYSYHNIGMKFSESCIRLTQAPS